MPFQLKNGQLKGLLIIIIFEFKDPLRGLDSIKIVLQIKIVIKFRSLKLEIPKAIPWITSPSWSSFLIIEVFMGGRVFYVNRASIVESSMRVLWCGFPYLCNLLSELPHLFLKLYKGPTNIKGLLKRNALRVRSFSFASHDSNL